MTIGCIVDRYLKEGLISEEEQIRDTKTYIVERSGAPMVANKPIYNIYIYIYIFLT